MPSARAAPVGKKERCGQHAGGGQVEDAHRGGPGPLAEHGVGAEPGVGLVEDLRDVVGRLRLDDEPADVGLGHPLAELGLDRRGHVVAQALHLTELVELRGGVRKGTAGHVVISPVRCSNRGGRPSPSVLCRCSVAQPSGTPPTRGPHLVVQSATSASVSPSTTSRAAAVSGVSP